MLPSSTAAGPLTVALGATLLTVTVKLSVALSPAASVRVTVTVWVASPSA